jgi:Leucine-rich repeat (LRR) protein
LRNNRLSAVPDSIAALPNLKKLDLRWNKLRVVPKWLPQLEASGCLVYR